MLNIDEFLDAAEHDARDHAFLPGVASCQIGFGSDPTMIVPNDFYGPATQTIGPVAGPGYPGFPADHPVPLTGFVVGCAWTTTGPATTNTFFKNGVLWLPLPPAVAAAPTGYAPMTGFPVTAGDTLALQFTGGPPGTPGLSSFVFLIIGS